MKKREEKKNNKFDFSQLNRKYLKSQIITMKKILRKEWVREIPLFKNYFSARLEALQEAIETKNKRL